MEARRPAWFALDSPRNLYFRLPGANLGSGISGLEARRPAFSRRGLLPPPREPLRLRPGEQILHTISAPPPSAGRLFHAAVCSQLLANPCSSVPGSKFFTQIPRLRPGTPGFFKARFAPRSPLTLVAPFRGANSSHKFRASARGRLAFSRRGLLPPPREPLRFRSGEQILHTNSAPPPGDAWLFQGAVCSPLPANPCSSVSGSKFFTQFPRRRPGTPGFFKARFAPPSSRTLAASFRGANSSHRFRAGAQKSTLPVYRQGASLSPTVSPQFARRFQSRGALLIN